MILENIKHPDDVKKIPKDKLKKLAGEIRWKIIKTVSINGGHLAPNLGTVEMTIALLRALNLPRDEVVWDVGHQAYPFKLLTGRFDVFHTLRQLNGMSGYLKRSESQFDIFGAGHSSTSLSAALGIAVAKEKRGEKGNIVAIIGDGALTSGIALEALNNIGQLKQKMTIILNTNEMSISKNTGAIARYLSKIITNPYYNRFIYKLDNFITKHEDESSIFKGLIKLLKIIKLTLVPGQLFESLGIRYFGPFDGHNMNIMEKSMKHIVDLPGPKIINVITKKGLGYKPAFEDPMRFHGTSPFIIETGKPKVEKKDISCSKIFGDLTASLIERDKKIIAISAAMGYGTGLHNVYEKYPKNYFDVGIEEEHAVVFSAGMSVKGLKPFVAIYSTFLQRTFDMLIHDIGIQKLPVRFFLDRAGIVGDDGETHHGIFDLSYLRMIPNMKIIAPATKEDLQRAIITAYKEDSGPIAVRYPRGSLPGEVLEFDKIKPLPEGKGNIDKESSNGYLFLSSGRMLELSKKIAEKIEEKDKIPVTVFDAVWIKPIDEHSILKLAKDKKLIVTFEDNTIVGGFTDAVLELLNKHKINIPVIPMGWEDLFPIAGTIQELFDYYNLNYEGLKEKIRRLYE